jgi:pyruvate dehydrogenase E2 component (dihydrolipoamide acetyltransferase)
MPTDITVPDLGDFKDVEVIDVLVKPGDQIDVDTPLLTLETEKATIDVPATAAGTITSLALKKGDRVSKGSLIGQLDAKGGATASGGAAGSTELASAPSKPEKTAPKGAKETGTAEEPVSTSSLSLAESQKNAGTAAKAAPATSGGGAPSDLTVPDIGDFKDVEVIDVLVKAGDRIDVDTPLLTLETEKATMDVPSTAAGVLKAIVFPEAA